MYETKTKAELLKEFNVDEKVGLSSSQVEENTAKYGPNKLAEGKKKSVIGIFLSQLNDPMIYILFAAAVISFIVSFVDIKDGNICWTTSHIDYAEPIIILSIVLLNGLIGTFQETKAEKALEALKKMSAPTAIVRRNGLQQTIPAEELVPGDIVILEEGSQVPCDLRLLSSVNLKTDESSLTGESLPISKDASIILTEEVGVGDRINICYMSTPVVYGHGEGIVISTGMNTEIGKIATMLNDSVNELTPLQKKLASLSKLLGIITIVLVVLFFVIAVIQASLQDKDLLATIIEMFVTAISLAVAAIPEGLATVVTIVLALGVQKMVKVNTIVRKLPSVETLGAVTVVCSDKTGTLTQNKMTVVEAYVNQKNYDKNELTNKNEDLIQLANGLCLCSNANIVETQSFGDPTEIALVQFAINYGNTKDSLEKITPRVNELPFDSVRKMMSTQHKVEEEFITYTKGAMDQILMHTDRIYVDGKIRKINEEDIKNINEASKAMANKALRVLALAKGDKKQIEEENLIFFGLVGMVDPPREEAKPAIRSFKKAGITTVMITGDHKDTAFAIAKELGIVESLDDCISGAEINALSEEELQEKAKTCRVFARVSPENKVSIVKAFRANNNVVAMTGDGVNDAPSLKEADIGIAMGITGTDVAKGAADMVLSDDNFASIEKAVEEGRGIYTNIKKTILFLLSSNIGEVICMFVAVCLGLPTPLAAIHILFVNLITDSLPAIALGQDKKDPDVMLEKPRDPKESLFAGHGYLIIGLYGLLIGLLTLAAFVIRPMQHLAEVGLNPFSLSEIIKILGDKVILREAETYAFIVLGVSQLFHMLGMSNMKKSFVHVFASKNWMFLIAFAFGILLPVIITEVDVLNDFFNCTKLTAVQWISLVGIASVPIIIHEIVVFINFVKAKIQNKKHD